MVSKDKKLFYSWAVCKWIIAFSICGIGGCESGGNGNGDGGSGDGSLGNDVSGDKNTSDCLLELTLYEINENGSTGDVAHTEEIDTCKSFALLSDDEDSLHIFLGVTTEQELGQKTVFAVTATFEILDSFDLGQEFTLSGNFGAGLGIELIPPDGTGDALSSYGRPYKFVLYMTEVGTTSGSVVKGEFHEVVTEDSYRDSYPLRLEFMGKIPFEAEVPEMSLSACSRWMNWTCEVGNLGGCDATCTEVSGDFTISCPVVGKCTCEKPGEEPTECSVMGGDCNRCKAALEQCCN